MVGTTGKVLQYLIQTCPEMTKSNPAQLKFWSQSCKTLIQLGTVRWDHLIELLDIRLRGFLHQFIHLTYQYVRGEELKYLENIEVEQSYLKSGHFCPNICTGQNPLI